MQWAATRVDWKAIVKFGKTQDLVWMLLADISNTVTVYGRPSQTGTYNVRCSRWNLSLLTLVWWMLCITCCSVSLFSRLQQVMQSTLWTTDTCQPAFSVFHFKLQWSRQLTVDTKSVNRSLCHQQHYQSNIQQCDWPPAPVRTTAVQRY